MGFVVEEERDQRIHKARRGGSMKWGKSKSLVLYYYWLYLLIYFLGFFTESSRE